MNSPVYTAGHSTRSFEEFVSLLQPHGIATVADIRRFPASRRHPHFSAPSFEDALEREAIACVQLPELGGRRKGVERSPNVALRNASFRAYADHMSSDEFRRGLQRLEELRAPVVLVCAEAVPWRCHRNLVADFLTFQGREVIHLIDVAASRIHTPMSVARWNGKTVLYDVTLPGQQTMFE